MKYPEPIYFTAIKLTQSEENSLELLNRIQEEDLTFHIVFDAEISNFSAGVIMERI